MDAEVLLGIKLHEHIQIEITERWVIVVYQPKHMLEEDGITVQENAVHTWTFSAISLPSNPTNSGLLHEGLK